MLENKKHNGIHYSRYIASWRNVGGKYFDEEFKEWLKEEGLNEEEIYEVRDMAIGGKLELEMNARKFIAQEHANYLEATKEERINLKKRIFNMKRMRKLAKRRKSV